MTVYLTLVIILVFQLVFADVGKLLNSIDWEVMLVTITIVNYFAMRYINHSTHQMQMTGVVANVKLRFLYVGCFGAAAALNTVAQLLNLLAKHKVEDTATQERLLVGSYCLLSSQNIAIVGAHFCMLTMFIRFSRKVTPKQQESLKRALYSPLASNKRVRNDQLSTPDTTTRNK